MDIILVILSVVSFITVSLCFYLSVKLSMLEDMYHISKLTKYAKVAVVCGVLSIGIWMSAVMFVVDGCR